MEASNIKDIVCPKCKKQFSQLNIPRKLQCSHSFCQKCIKQMMTKISFNRHKKYRVLCMFDKVKTQFRDLQSLSKNTHLLKLAKQNKLDQSKMVIIQKKSQKTQKTQIKNCLNKEARAQAVSVDKSSKKSNFGEQYSIQSCPLHNKPMQLVCVKDFQIICPNCKLFGQHKEHGHEAKQITQLDKQTQSLLQKLKSYSKQQKNCFERLSSNKLKSQVQRLAKKRKEQLQIQINKRLGELLDQIQLMREQTKHKLEKVIQDQKNNILNYLFQIVRDKQNFKYWQESLLQKISSLSNSNRQKRWRIALSSDEFINSCQKNISLIKGIQPNFLRQSQQRLNNIQPSTKQDEIKKYLKTFCQFQEIQNNKTEIRSSIIVTQIKDEQILLDGDEINYDFLSNSFVKVNFIDQRLQDLTKSAIIKVTSSGLIQNFKTPITKLKRVKSSEKQNFLQKSDINNSDTIINKQPSNNLLGSKTNRSSIANLLKFKELPPKYQQNILNVIKGKIKVLDLTNAQLDNQLLLLTLQRIKDFSITQMKLTKNGIDDKCFHKCVPFMDKITTLNISKNELTQESLNKILEIKKQGGLKSLKTLVATENRKIEKKYKEKLGQFKKLGINIWI